MYPLAMVVLATRFGALSDKRGTHGIVLCGLAIQSVSVLLYALCGAAASVYSVGAVMLLFGISSAMFYSPNASGIISNVPSTDIGMISGMNSAVRSISNAFGLNLFSLIIAARSSVYEARSLDAAQVFCYAHRDMAFVGAIILTTAFLLGLALLPRKKTTLPHSERRPL